MKRLYTIGYEAKTEVEFMEQIAAAGVRLVIDVRAVAASRRPGFSKTGLAGALLEIGVDYLHLRALGTPKEGRDAARRGETAAMREIYQEHLQTPEAEYAFEQAFSAAGRPALLRTRGAMLSPRDDRRTPGSARRFHRRRSLKRRQRG